MGGGKRGAQPRQREVELNTYPPPVLDIVQALAFDVPGAPVPQGSHSVSRSGHVFDSAKNHSKWRSTVTSFARAKWHGQAPIAGPVALSIVFWLWRPKTHYGTGRNANRVKPSSPPLPTGKGTGDLDKLIRSIGDSLTDAKVIVDDSQIVQLVQPTGKFYVPSRGRVPHASITVYQAAPRALTEPGQHEPTRRSN